MGTEAPWAPWDHPDADAILSHSSAMAEIAKIDHETKRQCKGKTAALER